ncbi:MAG: hypothetical protein BHW01_03855 [Clostridium sp. 27_14]|nr:MAG: hypothetical protein BHW01_03855 [Clostridium sp. 27_14]
MKKKGLKIIFIFFIFAFIMGNLTVVFADEYKGHKADGPWDAFYNYFIDMWASDQSKLTTAELERFVKGPTDKEMDLLKEGRGPTHYPDDTGIKEDVMNLIQTRNKSGDNSGKLDNDAWKKKRKEVVNLYTDKIAKEKDKTKKKKLYEQLIKKVEEMDKLNSKKTLEDSDIQSMYSEAIQALKKEPTIYENQVSEKDIKNSEEKNNKIYNQPGIVSAGNASSTLDDMMTDADSFVANSKSDSIDSKSLQDFSSTIYNIALQIGIGVAVVVGLALGIQFMLAGVDGQADVKKALIAYVVGCIAIFGAFGVWKLVIEVMQQI